jgi:hypothetical protein
MTGRQLSVLEQTKLLPHFAVAALANSDNRIILDYPKSLAPHLEAISRAAFLRIKERNTADMLNFQ